MVIFSSFKKSPQYPGAKYSIAYFQPAGFNYPDITCLAPIDPQGTPIRSKKYFKNAQNSVHPDNFGHELAEFREAVLRGYRDRAQEIKFWLQTLDKSKITNLVCWCPYTSMTRAQVSKYGFFACHCGILGEVISYHRPDIEIYLDDDRYDNLVPHWRFGDSWQPRLFDKPTFFAKNV